MSIARVYDRKVRRALLALVLAALAAGVVVGSANGR